MENFFDLQRFDEMLIMAPPDNNGGTPPDLPNVGEGNGGTPPDGQGGGNSSSSVTWSGATEITSAATVDSPTYTSTSSGQNAVLVNTSDEVTINNPTVTKSGGDSAGDNESFYGTNSAVMVKGGSTANIIGGTITSDAAGANGVFSYGGNGGQNGASGDGTTVNISDTKITTTGNGSGGIMTTGGGITVAKNLTVETSGQSSAAIRTDRGGGTVQVTGGTYTSNGLGSPAIYSTAAITVNDATLTSTKSEGVCIEGLNSVTLNNCTLNANNTQTNGQATFLDSVMIYQSMSGDSAEGTSTFTMNGGTINSQSGHVFHVTNTSAVINLNGVNINNSDSSNVLLSVSDDGWSGASNIATLTTQNQVLSGDILVGSNSTLNLNLSGTTFSGNISGNVTNSSGDVVSSSIGTVNVTLDETSKWYLTGNTYVSGFEGTASNVITNGYSLYVNNSVLDGTTTQETLPSGLTLNEDATSITADSTFTGTVNLNDYSNVTTFDATNDSNSIAVLGNSQNNSIALGDGQNSVYGGAGNNTLTGGSARDKFFTAGAGKDIVTNFVGGNGDVSDVVTIYNAPITNAYRSDWDIVLNMADGNDMTLQTDSDSDDEIILYSFDGENISGAKIGTADTLTYDSSVNFYKMDVEEGSLLVYDGNYKEIWLDNSKATYYNGVQQVFGFNNGDNLIAGNSEINILIGGDGEGSSSLWGGSGEETDYLQAGTGQTMFFYGFGQGRDAVINAKENDVVNMYDMTFEQIVDAQIDDESIVGIFSNDQSLTIYTANDVSPEIRLANGESYRYNRTSSEWSKN